MRSPALLLAAALAVSASLPSPASARARGDDDDDRPRPRPAPAARQRDAASVPYARPAPPYARAVPAPAPAAAPARYRYVRGRGWVAPAGVVVAAPWWWGWRAGWGYAPLYPRPAYGGEPGPYDVAPPDPDALHLRLSGTGTLAPGGGAAGLGLAVENRAAGANLAIDALAKDGVTGLPGGDHRAIAWGSAHATWSLLSDAVARVRLELGGSMLALPEMGLAAGQPWAGRIAFGPDVGVSGQLGLVGPLGIEGHARVTPFPVTVVDTRLALAVRGGPLAVTAGWRTVRVAGDGVDAPELAIRGPELGLSLLF